MLRCPNRLAILTAQRRHEAAWQPRSSCLRITLDDLRRRLHFDDLALERPWLGAPSDLPPHGRRDDHRQHLVTAPFASGELKGNCLDVPHTAVSYCAADQARDVYRAGNRAVIGRFDPAQRDR